MKLSSRTPMVSAEVSYARIATALRWLSDLCASPFAAMGRLTRSVSGSVERGRDRQGATDRCRSISHRVGTLLPGHLARKPGSTRERLFGSTRRPLPVQRVSFGTSGHQDSACYNALNEAHILAIAQAIVDRNARRIDGPLLIDIDTHLQQRLHSQRRFMTSSVVAVHAVSPASRRLSASRNSFDQT